MHDPGHGHRRRKFRHWLSGQFGVVLSVAGGHVRGHRGQGRLVEWPAAVPWPAARLSAAAGRWPLVVALTAPGTCRPGRRAVPGHARTVTRIGLRWPASDTPSDQPADVISVRAVVFTSASSARPCWTRSASHRVRAPAHGTATRAGGTQCQRCSGEVRVMIKGRVGQQRRSRPGRAGSDRWRGQGLGGRPSWSPARGLGGSACSSVANRVTSMAPFRHTNSVATGGLGIRHGCAVRGRSHLLLS